MISEPDHDPQAMTMELAYGSAGSTVVATQSRRLSTIRVILSLVLAVYWLSMFTGTHIPKVPSVIEGYSDKTLHTLAYFGLGVLLSIWQLTRRRVGWRTLLLFWMIIVAYGAFDEISQKYVGRTSDLWDWFADILGVTLGLGVTWLVTYLFVTARRPAPNPAV